MTFGTFSTEQCKLRGQSLVYSEQRLGSALYLHFSRKSEMVKRLDKSLATASSRCTVLYTACTGIFNRVSLFGGMERWNGIVEWWNTGTVE